MSIETKLFPPVIRKRDGTITNFTPEKIANAVFKAAQVVGGKDRTIADKVSYAVSQRLYDEFTAKGQIPTVDDSNRVCIHVLREGIEGKVFDATADAFETYSKDRIKARELQISEKGSGGSMTDKMLLIASVTDETLAPWDRNKIASNLQSEYKLSSELSKDISKEVENTIFNIKKMMGDNVPIPSEIVRRASEIHLLRRGISIKDVSISIPISTLEGLVFLGSRENSNISSNNPEAINLGIAEYILKQYNLQKIFSDDVSQAHNSGMVHIHDLGYPQRTYCSSHSIEYIKKFGLDKVVANLQNKSSPAKSAMVLNGHIQTFLASMQSNYAGALGFGFLNILYASMLNAPETIVEGELNGKKIKMKKDSLEELVESGEITLDENENGKNYFKIIKESKKLREMPRKEMRQIAQNLIFSGSQNAFSRGGQTLFIDFNIHANVPDYMKNVPVIGPGGKYMIENQDGTIELVDEVERVKGSESDSRTGDVIQPANGRKIITYGDPRMVKTAQKFGIEMMKVWGDGDKNGMQFPFPKCDFHVDKSMFDDPSAMEVYKEACRLASKNGSTYFMFDRQGVGATLAQCCRLKETVTDNTLLKHPERIRFTGFQNITINLPQAAYRSDNGLEGILENIDKAMNVAVRVHLQKSAYIQKLLDTPGTPSRSLGVPSDDGEPYIDLKKATYIIGVLGLNDCVQYLTGKELHESKEAYEIGIKIIDRMKQNADKLKEQYGLKFTLEETPAESATQKLAKGDLMRYKEEASKVVKGDHKKAPYYTNSIHLNPAAPVSIIDRIEMQSKFNDMVESGSITHVYCGESQIPAESIENLVEKTFRNTRSSQLTVSPEFTHCNGCHTNHFGFKDTCPTCNSGDVIKLTKIVGYFSNLNNWNESQLEISKAREKAARNYADLSPGQNWLYEDDNSKKIMVFGKTGCHVCEDAKNYLGASVEKHKLGVPVEFYDLLTPEGRLAASMHNVPLDVIPTILLKNNGTSAKHELEYKRGKMVMRNENSYEQMVLGTYGKRNPVSFDNVWE